MTRLITLIEAALLGLCLAAATHAEPDSANGSKTMSDSATSASAIFGGGCFWCTEAIFERVPGVTAVTSGYAGGTVANPTYKQVCTGTTGHAEAIKIDYNPTKVTFKQLLDVFFANHDPTTLNRQGADAGTQYRSAIFPTTPEQKTEAEAKIKSLNEAKTFGKMVVTTVEDNATFYPAEDYHQDFYRLNQNYPYCRLVIAPKVAKFEKHQKEEEKK